MLSVGWYLLRFWETGFFVAVRKWNTEDNALSAVHVRATSSLTRCRAVHVRMMTIQASTSLTRCRAAHVRMMTRQASTSLTRCRAVHVRPVRHLLDVGQCMWEWWLYRPVRHLLDVGQCMWGQYVTYSMSGSACEASTPLTRCRAVHVRPVRHLHDVGQCMWGQYVTYTMSGSACEASTSLTRCRASWADCRCRTSCSPGQKYWLPPQEEPAATAQRVTQENISPHRIARD